MKIALAAVAGVAVVALICAGLAWGMASSAQKAQVSQTVQYKRQLAALQTRVNNLDASVQGLTVPTDPLSAYNNVCNQQMTNGSSGITQTYYFPCTNQAQTIPQPGN